MTQSYMEKAFQTLNDLEDLGLVTRYAIGGAMAAIFYTEPFLTFDLDVFVVLPQTGGHLLSLTPIYEALRARGCAEENECVVIDNVPVQFLPAYNALVEEALNQAQEIAYEGLAARVLRSEYLIAIALQTGRSKDRERVRIFREQAQLDLAYLLEVLQRHNLEGKWDQWTS